MNGNGHKMPSLSRDYYWVCAIVKERPFVQGWHLTENEAYQWGFSNLVNKGVDFEVLPFRSINRIKVRDMWKNILLERGKRLESVLARAKYKL